ncbi:MULTISPECIES: cell division protein SepF [Aeromicrobium]|uniref:cell division protein SepF n=1 Tax=Aeromicrobium TaxID=2040 RepID=UPI0006F6BFA2|nr:MULTISPECIES: cell division protein SepF [Aeromicrobium]KQX76126.1 cell division protein SepF [Aeromicrobium sp. Root472D3]MBD8608216.1 cell division protein SepF [Aeromicrobium sp. CFBP 8757]
MAGAMRKVGEYLGLVEQADFDDEFDELEPDEAPARQQAPARQAAPAVVRPSTVSSIDERRRPERVERPERRASTASDLARIETVTPRTYNDARTVGEQYRAGVPVIMNLSEIDDDDAKRLVDFAAGLVFAVHGSINRVTAKVFLLSPENISVTDEDKQRIAAGGFFNQS